MNFNILFGWCRMFLLPIRAREVIMAELKSFQDYTEKRGELDRVEAALKKCADSESVVGGTDHLSELIEDYSLMEESLSKEELVSTVAGVLDPGDRIWRQILEKNGGKMP